MATRGRRLSKAEKVEFWREHVVNWRTSGMTQAAYCRDAGVSGKSFGYWKRRLEQYPPPFSLPVVAIDWSDVVGPSPTPSPAPLRLCLGSRFAVEINGDFCSPVLEKLVRTLEGLA